MTLKIVNFFVIDKKFL